MTWERWCNLSSHGAVCAGEMVQIVEKSCSRMKENVRNLLKSTFPTAFRAQEKRKELDLAKADIIKCINNKVLNATTTKFKAELRFGSQILPKCICSNSLCCQ